MNYKLIIIALVLGSLGYSCKKDLVPLYSNGMITGTIKLFDGANASNIRITAFGPYGSPSTLSDSNGNYKLSGLGNGTNEIEFFKEGYGKIYRHGVQIFGNDTISINALLYKMADYQMPKLGMVLYYSSFSFMDEYSVAIVTDIKEDNNEEMHIRIFVGDNEDISHINYTHSDRAYAVKRENSSQVLVACVNPQIVNSGGARLFEKGQTLYLIAYVCSNQEEYGEFNVYYGLPVFSTVDEQQHSQVIIIKAPDK